MVLFQLFTGPLRLLKHEIYGQAFGGLLGGSGGFSEDLLPEHFMLVSD
jgi:hypothetical protein